jgi:filamentous hemagglutinin
VHTLGQQIDARAGNLPPGTAQRVFVDIRGQHLSIPDAEALAERISQRTGGVVRPEDVEFKSR